MNASPSLRRGFTLIEMLVSISIVSFMLIMLAQITSLTEKAWRMEQNRIDNFTKARSMLDLITDDLQRAVFRGDLPAFGTGGPAASPAVSATGLYYFTGTSFTNAFYTRIAGVPTVAATPVRDLSLVSYVLTTTAGPDKSILQRSDLAVPWTSSQNILFQGNLSDVLANAPPTPLEVAPGVVGFRLAFRRADGTMIDQSGYTGYSSSNPVVAVDVGIAVIGKQDLATLSGPQITALQNAFAGATISNGIKASWDKTVLTPTFYAAYPKDLGGSIKTFERWVACTPF